MSTEICINCEKSENEAPILTVHFKGNEVGICSACLPVLIHKPEKLADRLEGAAAIPHGEHHHD